MIIFNNMFIICIKILSIFCEYGGMFSQNCVYNTKTWHTPDFSWIRRHVFRKFMQHKYNSTWCKDLMEIIKWKGLILNTYRYLTFPYTTQHMGKSSLNITNTFMNINYFKASLFWSLYFSTPTHKELRNKYNYNWIVKAQNDMEISLELMS